MIPVADLPLQTILEFTSPPAPLAASYLQGICLSQGDFIERSELIDLYDSPCDLNPLDIPDDPINPRNVGLPLPDLRRAIHQLQLLCVRVHDQGEQQGQHPDKIGRLSQWDHSMAQRDPVAIMDAAGVLLEMAAHADLVSFIDCHLTRRPWDRTDVGLLLATPSPD